MFIFPLIILQVTPNMAQYLQSLPSSSCVKICTRVEICRALFGKSANTWTQTFNARINKYENMTHNDYFLDVRKHLIWRKLTGNARRPTWQLELIRSTEHLHGVLTRKKVKNSKGKRIRALEYIRRVEEKETTK